MIDRTRLYSERVDWYVKGRPNYPASVLGLLDGLLGSSPGAKVADVGSGTGIFTSLLLSHGLHVYGVEPDQNMRTAAERLNGANPRFTSVFGCAEQTTLPDASVNAVTVAQALHWFDLRLAKKEFRRILCGDGPILLLWNERRRTGSPLLHELDSLLLALLPGYQRSLDFGTPHVLAREFLGHTHFQTHTLTHFQELDEDGLLGRVFSASYSPPATSDHGRKVAAALEELFSRHAEGGKVRIEYETIIIVARLG